MLTYAKDSIAVPCTTNPAEQVLFPSWLIMSLCLPLPALAWLLPTSLLTESQTVYEKLMLDFRNIKAEGNESGLFMSKKLLSLNIKKREKNVILAHSRKLRSDLYYTFKQEFSRRMGNKLTNIVLWLLAFNCIPAIRLQIYGSFMFFRSLQWQINA